MATVIRREVRQRGALGWICISLFWAFNILMLYALIRGVAGASDVPVASEAERTGRSLGTAIGVTMLVFFWAMGSVILGFLALLTRGRKTIIETSEEA